MILSQFQIQNFKSYRDSGVIRLTPGFTVVTGQNHTGKTALLEALSLNIFAAPHKSLATKPKSYSPLADESIVRVGFTVDREELLLLLAGTEARIPRPRQHNPEIFKRFIDVESHEFEVELVRGASEQWRPTRIPSFGMYDAEDPPNPKARRTFVRARIDVEGKYVLLDQVNDEASSEIGAVAVQLLRRYIYRFNAQRIVPSKCMINPATSKVSADASNLPSVLLNLRAKRLRFEMLNAYLHDIFPYIHEVQVKAVTQNEAEIYVWNVNPMQDREDLAVPLSEAGTGVGQVLSILTVVLEADHPTLILLDEPQSFLHPGAIRKLIEILKGYPRHQYIIATHSPVVISSCDPGTVLLARLNEGSTELQRLSVDARDLRIYLAEIGARLSDVFGADKILWVEGATEEEAFSRIVERLIRRPLMGTAIIGLKQTGDLQGRDAERVFEIYNRVTESGSLLPPTIGFILDRECKRDDYQRELIKRSKGQLRFLDRRMYENYLLNQTAIAEVINRIEGFRNPEQDGITAEQISRFFNERRNQKRYYCPGVDIPMAEWQKDVDGAQLLKDLFAELSENRVPFRKVEHSIALTDWLIDHAPEELRPIADLLQSVLSTEPVGFLESAIHASGTKKN